MKLLICDDSAFVRERYVRQIGRIPSVGRIIETQDVTDTIAAILAERPEVALLDYRLGTGTALDVMHGLKFFEDRPRIFILSSDIDTVPQGLCGEAGAEGFFEKGSGLIEALAAVRAIASRAGHQRKYGETTTGGPDAAGIGRETDNA